MRQVFTDHALQTAFEKTVQQYELFRVVVAKKVDCSNPAEVVQNMTELTEVMAIGVTCKAQFQYHDYNTENRCKKCGGIKVVHDVCFRECSFLV